MCLRVHVHVHVDAMLQHITMNHPDEPAVVQVLETDPGPSGALRRLWRLPLLLLLQGQAGNEALYPPAA